MKTVERWLKENTTRQYIVRVHGWATLSYTMYVEQDSKTIAYFNGDSIPSLMKQMKDAIDNEKL
jgi:hypothetical protein